MPNRFQIGMLLCANRIIFGEIIDMGETVLISLYLESGYMYLRLLPAYEHRVTDRLSVRGGAGVAMMQP